MADNPFGTGSTDPLPTGSEMPSGLIVPPYRRDFDAARDPYAARNAIQAPEEALRDGKLYARRNAAWQDTSAIVIPLLGVSDGSSAASGVVGEVLTANQSTPQALTNNTCLSLASVLISQGDWDLNGVIGFTGNAATTVNYVFSELNNTLNTLSNSLGRSSSTVYAGAAVFGFTANLWLVTPTLRLSFTGASQTWYVNAQAGFAVNTCSATGLILARRRR